MPKQPEINVTEGDETGWETASSDTSHSSTSKQLSKPARPIKEKRHRRKRDKPAVYGPPIDPLEQYWVERAKLVKHLEKRFTKFLKRSREDYDRARNPPVRKASVPNQAASQAVAPPRKVGPAVNNQKQKNGNPAIMPTNAIGAARTGGTAVAVGQPSQTLPPIQASQDGGLSCVGAIKGVAKQKKAPIAQPA